MLPTGMTGFRFSSKSLDIRRLSQYIRRIAGICCVHFLSETSNSSEIIILCLDCILLIHMRKCMLQCANENMLYISFYTFAIEEIVHL